MDKVFSKPIDFENFLNNLEKYGYSTNKKANISTSENNSKYIRKSSNVSNNVYE